MALSAFTALCAAARTHGNGIVEVTSRGSVQIRGLTAASAPRFAADIEALGIAAPDGTSVLCNALAGLDADEVFDAAALAAELRGALASSGLQERLAPKVSVVIDGGGLTLNLVAADVRLRATLVDGVVAVHLSIGGDAGSAAPLGVVAPADAVEATLCALGVIAGRGRAARARDVLAAEGVAPFRAALGITHAADDLVPTFPKVRSDPIGLHRLHDRLLACGIGLAFGHADAEALIQVANAAGDEGAHGLRAAPGRTVLAIGMRRDAAARFGAAAARLGFIIDPGDPRRRVIACAGAPVCASAHIAARAMAPAVATAVAPLLGDTGTVHLSGCAKGCAHPASATLTVVGTPAGCALVPHGSARDAASAVVPVEQLAVRIAEYARDLSREGP
jgi:precorrin-3B synthase